VSEGGNPVCRLCLLQYPRAQVLNQRIENSLRFGHRQVIEGVILAIGANPIPKTYYHGLIVPIQLAFLDQNQNEIRENAELFVDRLYKPKRKSMPRRSGLYDRGTIVPTSAEVINQNQQTEFRDPEFQGGTDCSLSKRP
jgi:hypothetical protein